MSSSIRWDGVEYDGDTTVIDAVNVLDDDLAPLATLPRLEILRVEWTDPHETPVRFPTSLEPLRGLGALRELSLPGWVIDDLEPLREVTRLERLDLSDTLVEDLTPLEGLKALTHVSIDGCPVRSLAPLRRIDSLRSVSVRRTDVTRYQIRALRAALSNINVTA